MHISRLLLLALPAAALALPFRPFKLPSSPVDAAPDSSLDRRLADPETVKVSSTNYLE